MLYESYHQVFTSSAEAGFNDRPVSEWIFADNNHPEVTATVFCSDLHSKISQCLERFVPGDCIQDDLVHSGRLALMYS